MNIVNPDLCLHQNNYLFFTDTGQRWYVCNDCGKYLQKSELTLYKRISELTELLQKVVDDSEVGVVPRSHLDRIAQSLEGYWT